jgi:phosphatidyl-myo-inositol dimannoside synthase
VPEPRALVLSTVFPPARGGIEIMALRIAEGLQSLKPRVVTLDEPGAREFDAGLGIDVVRVRNRPRGGRRAVALLNARALADAWAHKPRVVLNTYVRTAPAAAAIARMRRVPFVQYVHAKEVLGWERQSRLAFRRAAAVIAVSSYTEQLAIEFGADPARVARIPPGVDLPRAAVASRFDQPTLLTVSRLEHAYKGHDVLARALPGIRERVPGVRWAVLGDGPLRQRLERQVEQLGVADAVEFLGAASDATRDEWMARSHVFAMTSRVPPDRYGGEGFGIVYLEAAAHGLPVVAGRSGGTPDALIDGETGLLVDPEDPAEIAQAVSALLLDPERAARMGEAGRRFAAGFAWPGIVERVEQVLLAAGRR